MTQKFSRPSSSRLFVVLVVIVMLFALLGIRLFDVQLLQGAQYTALADDNRLYEVSLSAPRGVILDRFGQPLVWNKRSYMVKADPAALYSQVQPISPESALRMMATDSASIETRVVRDYRYGPVLAQVLGYIGSVTAEDLEAKPQLAVTDLIGRMGLEAVWDARLRGQNGQETLEINAQTTKLRTLHRQEPIAGENVHSTIDGQLSTVAYEALGDKKGAVVILDADTGHVLTLVSKPSFNPNLFQTNYETPAQAKVRQATIMSLFKDEQKPFFNRSINGVYPPGSIFKLVTALAGLQQGSVTTESTVLDEGVLKVGEYQYGNWYYRQFGRTEGEIGLIRAISRSNDIFFYKAAEWTGPEKLAETAMAMGLGRVTGVELTPEAKGLVPTPEWKEKTLGERWFLGNTYHIGIGQGDLLVTPLQLAQVMQVIANDGELCQPSLEKKETLNCHALGFSTDHLKIVLRGMLDACSPGGTAFPFFPRNQRLRRETDNPVDDLHRGAVACKTGTAEFGAADERGYRPTHGWWAGIVEPQWPSVAPSIVPGEVDELVGSSAGGSDDTASASARVATTGNSGGPDYSPTGSFLRPDYLTWLEESKKQGYPKRLVIVVLVESDETNLYREGSRDAGPVGDELVKWLEGETGK